MGDYKLYLDNAKRYVATADHLLTETYPLVKDPRMLLTVLQNIYGSFKSCMMYMLYKDVADGKIPEFDQDFETMLAIFKARAERRYRIKPEYIQALEQSYKALKTHKESPMEFSRHEMFVICSDKYETQTITTANLRDYIGKAKLFIGEIDSGRVKNERVFG